jgi:hypothetical protein
MAAAIQAALAIRVPPDAQRDLLLITDAEVWASDQLVDLVAQSKYRMFVVAVGAAPNEALARQLAERTGGACEFVSPNEDAEAAIVRMFKRMREAPRSISRVEWPAVPVWEAARPEAVFSGDVVHLVAAFGERPEGVVRMTVQAADGSVVESTCALAGEALEWDAVPRVAIARRIETLGDEEAAELAERYQIGSRHTSFVLVHKRAEGERADSLPELKTVRQMLAAGWGGAGSVLSGASMSVGVAQNLGAVAGAVFSRRTLPPVAGPALHARPDMNVQPRLVQSMRLEDAELDEASLMERVRAWMPKRSWGEQSPQGVLQALNAEIGHGGRMPKSYKDLERLGVPEQVVEQLKAHAEREGFAVARVVRVFIALLAERYADEIGPEVAERLIGETFERGANQLLRRELGPMSEWAVAETA